MTSTFKKFCSHFSPFYLLIIYKNKSRGRVNFPYSVYLLNKQEILVFVGPPDYIHQCIEFSFLLGLVTLSAATAYDTLKHGQVMLQTFDALSLAVGVLFAFFAAILSVKWMVGYLNSHGLAAFGYYRVGLALVAGALLMSGAL